MAGARSETDKTKKSLDSAAKSPLKLVADTAKFVKDLASARSEAAKTKRSVDDASKSKLKLVADTSGFKKAVASARAEVEKAKASMEDTAKSSSGFSSSLKKLSSPFVALSRDAKNFNVEGMKTNAVTRSMSSGFHALGDAVGVAAAGLKGAKLPGMIAAIAAATPMVLGLAGAAGQLAIALGSGLAGAVAIGYTAVGGAVAGLKAYSAILNRVISDSRSAYEATHELAVQQLEDQRNTILNTQASTKWNEQLNKSAIALTKVEAAIGNKVFPALTKLVALWTSKLPQLTPPIMKLTQGVTKVGVAFASSYAKGAKFARLKSILDFVSASGIGASVALTQLGDVGIAALSKMIPFATKLQVKILGLTGAFQKWGTGTAGMKQMTALFAVLNARMMQVFRIAGNLGKALFGIFQGLSGAGGPQKLLNGLEGVTAAFAKMMRAGGSARKSITAFMKDINPALKATWHFALEAAKQVLILAHNVASAGRSGGGIGTLAKIINSLKNALEPMQRLFSATFKSLGPLMAPLIKGLAGIVETFAGSSGVLVSFIRNITKVLTIFNNLPGPVKTAAAEFTAASMTMKLMAGTSIPGLISGLAKVVTANRLMANTAKATTVQIESEAAATEAAGAASASSGPKMGIFAKGIKGVGTAVKVAFGPIGLIVALGTAIVLAFVSMYKSSEPFRKSISNLGKAFKGAFGPILKSAANSLKGLGINLTSSKKAGDSFAKGINWVAKQVTAFGKALPGVIHAVTPFAKAVVQGFKDVVSGAKAVVKAVAPFAKNVAKGFKEVVGTVKAVPKAFQSLYRGVTSAINRLGKWLSQKGKAIGDFIVKPFVWAKKKLVGGSIIPEMVKDILKWIGDLPKKIMALIKKLPGQLVNLWKKQIWDPMAKYVVDKTKGILQTLSNWKNKAVAWVHSLVGAVLNYWKNSIWKAAAEWVVQKAKGIMQTLTNWKTKAVSWVKSLVPAIVKYWQNSVFGKMASWVIEKAKGIMKTLGNWKNDAISWVKSLVPDFFKPWSNQWQDAADWVIEKKDGILQTMENLKQGIISAWKGISSFVGGVLSSLGLSGDAKDTSNPKTKNEDPRFRAGRGGPSPPSPKKNAAGGVIHQGSVGGVADGGTPRAVYGEVGKREYYIVPERQDNVQFLQGAAEDMGFGLVKMARGGMMAAWKKLGIPTFAQGGKRDDDDEPMSERDKQKAGKNRRHAEKRHPRFAHHAKEPKHGHGRHRRAHGRAGGHDREAFSNYTPGGPTLHTLAPEIRPRVEHIAADTGTYWDTYAGHGELGGSVQNYTSDFWGSPQMGSVSTSQGYAVANDALSKYNSNPGLLYMIRQGEMWRNIWNGWKPWPSDPHMDHTHVSWIPPGGEQTHGGSGGVSVPNPLQAKFEQLWASKVQPLVEKLSNSLQGGFVLRQAAAKASENRAKEAYDWIDAKIPDFIGGASGAPAAGFTGKMSGSGMDYMRKSLKEYNLPSNWATNKSLWSIAQSESGTTPQKVEWEPNGPRFMAPWGIIVPNRYGVAPQSPAQERFAVGPRYVKDQYGSPEAAWSFHTANGWYKRGGVHTPGSPGQRSSAGGGKSLRLQMPKPVENAFKRVADTLHAFAGRSPVPVGDQGGVGTGKHTVAITNEAGPEAIIPKKRTPEGEHALRTANNWYAGTVGHSVAGYAEGGVAGFATGGRLARRLTGEHSVRSRALRATRGGSQQSPGDVNIGGGGGHSAHGDPRSSSRAPHGKDVAPRSGTLPPKQSWNLRHGMKVLKYTADPSLASLAAAGAHEWHGLVVPGKGGARVVPGFGSARRGYTGSNGVTTVGSGLRPQGMAHEFGHGLGLNHGGHPSIMGGAPHTMPNDFLALKKYYGIGGPKGPVTTKRPTTAHRTGNRPSGYYKKAPPGAQVFEDGSWRKGSKTGCIPGSLCARERKHTKRMATGGVLSASQIDTYKTRGNMALGKPYVYGSTGTHAGPDGYSCSGLWNWILTGSHAETGRGTYAYKAGTMGLAPGPGQVEIGVDTAGWGGPDGTHMAGDIAGISYESTVGAGVHHGHKASAFGSVWHLGAARGTAKDPATPQPKSTTGGLKPKPVPEKSSSRGADQGDPGPKRAEKTFKGKTTSPTGSRKNTPRFGRMSSGPTAHGGEGGGSATTRRNTAQGGEGGGSAGGISGGRSAPSGARRSAGPPVHRSGGGGGGGDAGRTLHKVEGHLAALRKERGHAEKQRKSDADKLHHALLSELPGRMAGATKAIMGKALAEDHEMQRKLGQGIERLVSKLERGGHQVRRR